LHQKIKSTVNERKKQENQDRQDKILGIKNNLNNIKKQCMRAFSSRQRIMEDANKELDE
jgi:hypothetical protein